MRKIRQKEIDEVKEDKEKVESTLNFLTRTRWKKAADEKGGITWLELFIF